MRTICFLSLLLFANARAQQGIVITEAAFAVDSLSQWRPGHLPDGRFSRLGPGEEIQVGYNDDAAVWCAITLANQNTRDAEQAWLCFDNNHLDSITVFNGRDIRMLGDRTTAVSPFITTQAFSVSLQPGEKETLLVRVKKGISFFEFAFALREGTELRKSTSVKVAVISFLLGIIFLLLVFNGILFFTTRRKMYGYYIGYSALSAIYIAITSYYAKYVLFGGFRYFSELRVYTASLWLMALVAFLAHYIDLRNVQPKKYRAIRILNYVNLLAIVVTIVLLVYGNHDYMKLGFLAGYLVFLAVILLTTWAALAGIRKRPAENVYVLLAFVPHFIWGLGIILKSFGVIEKELHEDVLIYICLYEVLLFGYVLAKDYIAAFQKNNQLMRDIIAEKENTLHVTTTAQIRERRNVANLIHDNLGSRIAYILQLIELGQLPDAHRNISELAIEIRDVSHKILPKSLDDGALAASLKSQVEAWNKILPDARIEIYTFDFPEKIDAEWVFDLYLISIEIITNALRHGKAKLILLEFYGYDDQYVFQFTDDGSGFDTATQSKGFGLETIEGRVLSHHGTFDLNSARGEGTVIQIVIPVR